MTTVTRTQLHAAAGLVVTTQFGSINMLRRRLDLSHAKAVEVMATLEEHGIVGPDQHGRARDVLIRAERLEEARAPWSDTRPDPEDED